MPADRGFNGYVHGRSAQATGAQLLWRCAANRQLPVTKPLPDGSFLSQIRPSKGAARSDKSAAVTVRVIEYTLPGTHGEAVRYRLLSTLLDCEHAPALELAALYHERGEVEGVFDELKTHLHQRRWVLHSKKPDLVRQEFYGWVLAHYAVRWLMHSAGSAHEVEPRRLSIVFCSQCAATQTSPAPIRGLSPRCARDCVSAGLRRCWHKRPPCYVPAAGAAPIREW